MIKRWSVKCLLMLTIGLTSFIPEDGHGQSKAMSAEELTSRAAIVAVGRVTSLRSEWSGDRTRIVTQVTVTVDQYLKGNQQSRTLTITVPGGEVDGVGELYSHIARFRDNEDVVVFAERDARGGFRITGGEQGKFTVTTETRTGKRVVGENQLLEVFTSRVQNAARSGQ